jgi:Fe-S-cluster containining protein
MSFPCDACGLCCTHVDRSELTAWMDRGDGVCVRLADDLRTCTIYESRPAYCRVDESYALFANTMRLAAYYKANAEVCNTLRFERRLALVTAAITGEQQCPSR